MPAGRPRKYKTVEELQPAIDTYFENAGDKPTMSGLAYELGFADRCSLLDYEGKDEFSRTIKKARQRVEQALELRLYDAAPAGVIFNLKNNFGWKDRTEQALTDPEGNALTVQVVNFANDSDTE